MVWGAEMTSAGIGSAPPAAPDRPKRKHVRSAQGKLKPGPPRTLMTTEQQAKATTLAAAGWSQERIAKTIGRSRNAVKHYLEKPEAIAEVRDERQELVELYRDKARACVIAIDDEKIGKSSALQLATASGICLDKSLLLDGKPTVNVAVLVEVCDLIRKQDEEESERRQQQYNARRLAEKSSAPCP